MGIKEMFVYHNLTFLDQVFFVLHEGDYLPFTVYVVQILEDFARVVDNIFKEIAISVVLQDAEEVIVVRIAAIASRVSDACDSPQGGKHLARRLQASEHEVAEQEPWSAI